MLVKLLGFAPFPKVCFAFAQARKLPNIWAINSDHYAHMANALYGAHSTLQFGTLLSENVDQLTDQQVAYALHRIQELDLDADQHFYNLIVPVLKDFVFNFQREHAESFAQIVGTCGYLNVKDAELWQLFEAKLIQERLYRYIPLSDLITMTCDVAQSEFGSAQFFQTMEAQIGRHKLALTSEEIKQCTEAFEKKKIAGPIIKSLQDQQKKQLA